MTFPVELRFQIGDNEWESLSKKEQLHAIAWAMESIVMSDKEKLSTGDVRKLNKLSVMRKAILKDYIKDVDNIEEEYKEDDFNR